MSIEMVKAKQITIIEFVYKKDKWYYNRRNSLSLMHQLLRAFRLKAEYFIGSNKISRDINRIY